VKHPGGLFITDGTLRAQCVASGRSQCTNAAAQSHSGRHILVEFERMSWTVVQIVISGMLLVVVAWSTFVDVFASAGTTGHTFSFASFLVIRLIVILLLLWWFIVSCRRRSRRR